MSGRRARSKTGALMTLSGRKPRGNQGAFTSWRREREYAAIAIAWLEFYVWEDAMYCLNVTIPGMASAIWREQLCCLFIVTVGTANVFLSRAMHLPWALPAPGRGMSTAVGIAKGKEAFPPAALAEQESRVLQSAFICGRLFSAQDPWICFEGWIMRLHEGQDRLHHV